MEHPPSGTVTFLFTDIEGSTRRWQDVPESMRALLAEHDEILRDAIEKHHGHLFKHTGDGVAAAFPAASDAVDAAVDAQQRVVEVLPVRMGLHTGEAELRDGDYFGTTLNRCARLMGIAHGGQILCSAATVELVRDRTDLRDLGEHRLRDLSRAERVWQVGAGKFATLRSVNVAASNLPTALTELVGRSDDIYDLSRLVLTERVVTLTGTGGVGKTRLSLAVAAAVASEFFDGVWLIELAPVADGAGVVRAAAAALGVTATVGVDEAGLVNHLRGRRLVLVMDNCEHVLNEAVDFVDAVVADAPEVHLIVTSREPLGIEGEIVRRVRSLGVPDDDTDSAAVDASDAVRMFVERASAADGDFALDATNRTAVVEICRKLDGIPLAIELAAARVRAMTPTQIAGRLDERFRLLSGARRAQERHRTLQAAVSWSYDLLPDTEQRAFRCLSVFPASFDLPAAEAVTDDAGALDDVLHLVDRSLVQHDPDTGRYRLLETLRQYGAERAVEAGEAGQIRDRYIEHYLELVADVGPAWEDPGGYVDAATTLRAERDNITAVAELLLDDNRGEEVRRLCVDARGFLVTGAPALVVRWMEAVVESGSLTDAQGRVDALALISHAAAGQGDGSRAGRRAAESMAIAANEDVESSALAHQTLARLALVQGRRDEYLAHMTAAVGASDRESRHTRRVIRASWLDAHLRVHGYPGNDGLIEEIRQENSGHPASQAVAQMCTAGTAIMIDRDLDRGLRYLDAEVAPELIATFIGAWLGTLRAVALTDVDPTGAISAAVAAARSSDRVGSPYALHAAVVTLAMLAARTGRIDEARRLGAHAEAFPQWQNNPSFSWVRADTVAALTEAGIPTPLASAELTRRELFAILARLEAAV